MRILVDANIWISIFLGSERLSEIIEDGYFRHQLLTSKGIIHELESVLTGKLNYTHSEIQLALAFVRQRAKIVEMTSRAIETCRDPADNHVLSAALAGNADCVLTGDKDLLVLKKIETVSMISPNQFRAFEENYP